MSFYNENYEEYIDRTINADMGDIYKFFLKYAKTRGKLLDIGFGSGRDMLYFKSLGFDTYGIDPEPIFVSKAKEKGLEVECIDINDCFLEYDKYDYIWACASLLHIKKEKLNQVFIICSNLLKDNGIMYCSFKYGEFEGIIDNRYYTNLNEES
ncbi:MAG: class I SAM-dependent methyltransferase, partial [Acholeplasmatales bacterium]|nr:class I SAM-dependent methyltransferase [Acholeplasmatales bacterium]